MKNESKAKEKTVVIQRFYRADNKRNDKTEQKSVCSRNSCSNEKVREKSVVVKSVICDVCVCRGVWGGGRGRGGGGGEPSPINYSGDTSHVTSPKSAPAYIHIHISGAQSWGVDPVDRQALRSDRFLLFITEKLYSTNKVVNSLDELVFHLPKSYRMNSNTTSLLIVNSYLFHE